MAITQPEDLSALKQSVHNEARLSMHPANRIEFTPEFLKA